MEEDKVRIVVENRKDRAERVQTGQTGNRPQRTPSGTGDQRGGFRNRGTAGGGRGRGGGQPGGNQK